jgi:hypothetical protein
MANAKLLMYGSKHLQQNFFFFLKKCEYPMVLSDLEIPPDLKILVNLAKGRLVATLQFLILPLATDESAPCTSTQDQSPHEPTRVK